MATTDLTGKEFGRWTVLEKVSLSGAARWRCRCSCGTERDVAARHLLSGATMSCGCIAKENRKEKHGADLSGRRFGKLHVLSRAEPDETGAQRWLCRCACGREYIARYSPLNRGQIKSCGCEKGQNRKVDIAGRRFNMLTAMYPTDKREHGRIVWHCRCDCGKETDVSTDKLMNSTHVISCGCMREKCEKEIAEKVVRVEGTSIDIIRSDKVRPDNPTGVKGVTIHRGKYIAEISFQHVRYGLGSFRTLEEAALARKAAEQLLHKDTVEFYDRWKKRAAEDPEWGENNPISIHVERDRMGVLRVEFLPDIR